MFGKTGKGAESEQEQYVPGVQDQYVSDKQGMDAVDVHGMNVVDMGDMCSNHVKDTEIPNATLKSTTTYCARTLDIRSLRFWQYLQQDCKIERCCCCYRAIRARTESACGPVRRALQSRSGECGQTGDIEVGIVGGGIVEVGAVEARVRRERG